jgi:phosphate starvation-inducible membrane PsiE
MFTWGWGTTSDHDGIQAQRIFHMIDLISILVVVALTVQAFIGLSFLATSIYEKEKRASFFASIQFVLMLLILFGFVAFTRSQFFNTTGGHSLLVIGAMVAAGAGFWWFAGPPPMKKHLKELKG